MASTKPATKDTSMTLSASEIIAQEFAASWQWRIDTDPELAAAFGMLARRRSTHALDPRSLESFEQRLKWVDRALDRIRGALTTQQIQDDLTPQERLSYQLYVQQLTDYVTYTRQHR